MQLLVQGVNLKQLQSLNPQLKNWGMIIIPPPTSNDANTIAHQGSDLITGSKGYEETSAIEIKSFSKNLNSKYHEGPCTFYDKANKIIFTRNGGASGGGIFGQGKKDEITRLKLYSAEKKRFRLGKY